MIVKTVETEQFREYIKHYEPEIIQYKDGIVRFCGKRKCESCAVELKTDNCGTLTNVIALNEMKSKYPEYFV